ncbi:MAG TPA: peptidylprolyl isomerase [Gemmatimonadales bacterium]
MRRIVTPARLFVLSSLIGLGSTGCSNFRDLFAAHADVAAEAAGQELPAKRLALIMSSAGKGVQINQETADFVANIWVDYSLLGQAVAQGKLPVDSASVTEVVWPEISEIKGMRWHDTLMARRGTFPDSSVDSLYRAPDLRTVQHILFSVRANSPAGVRDSVKRQAEAALAKIRKGASFNQLAATLSSDAGSVADSGYLPPSPRGRFVPAFDSVAWSLEPGKTSGLVESPFGYHIIKRPTLAEARPRLSDFLVERAGQHLDSLYMDSLSAANKVEILSNAPASMRAAAESPDDSRRSTKELVRFKGGALTVQEYLRWMRALPPQYASQLKTANDSMLNRFARILTQNLLLLREADAAKVSITSFEWATLQRKYLSQLDTLKGEMGLNQADLTDSSVALGEREKVAQLRVERYFDQLIAGKSKLRPLPSALATLLRERLPYRVHVAGVNSSMELATEMKAKADSANPAGAMQRAPGPPPIPGAAPAAPTGAAPPTPSPGAAGATPAPAPKKPAK